MLYVYKCMQGKLQYTWRGHIIFILMIVMLVSLFFSRAVLSVGIVVFTVVSFLHAEPLKQVRSFFQSPLLWGMSLLFFLPLLSGIWSDDKAEWQLIMLIKAPLFLLPLAFAGPVQLSKQQWEGVASVFILLIAGASVWSLFHYMQNVAEVNEGYLRAKTLITPLGNDHVRFSWLVSVAVLLGSCLCVSKYKERRKLFWILSVITGWLIIFLHILAARTGLISFYILLAGFCLWFMIKRIKWKYGVAMLIIIIGLPVIAYKTLPSFHNRVNYFRYEFEYFKKTHYLPGANDAVRIISIKAGWNVMQQQPATGVGFGDVFAETKEWYDANYPQMIEADKIYPSAQWAMYGAGCGWPGIIVFVIAMFIPFFVKTRHQIVWWLLNATAIFSLLFDPGLEVQFGVFVYSFTVLWFWKWLSEEKM